MAIVEAGGGEVVVAALQRYGDGTGNVAGRAMEALCNLASPAATRERLVAEDAVPALLDAVRDYPGDERVQAAGFQAMQNFISSEADVFQPVVMNMRAETSVLDSPNLSLNTATTSTPAPHAPTRARWAGTTGWAGRTRGCR